MTANGPGGCVQTPEHPLIAKWCDPVGSIDLKMRFKRGGDPENQCEPTPYFRFPPFLRLLVRLCKLIQPYSEGKERLRQSGKKAFPLRLSDGQRDYVYHHFVAHIDQAISEVEKLDFDRVFTDAELDEARNPGSEQIDASGLNTLSVHVQPEMRIPVLPSCDISRLLNLKIEDRPIEAKLSLGKRGRGGPECAEVHGEEGAGKRRRW